MKAEIIKNIEETIKYNKAARSGDDVIELYKDATRKSNDTLARVRHYINNNNEYSRGLDDAWRAVRMIFGNGEESLFSGTICYLFGVEDLLDIANKYEAHDVISILDEYEKEQEEKKKLKIGDIVDVINIHTDQKEKGVFLNESTTLITYIAHDGSLVTIARQHCNVVKTGEHVDILGALGKE